MFEMPIWGGGILVKTGPIIYKNETKEKKIGSRDLFFGQQSQQHALQ